MIVSRSRGFLINGFRLMTLYSPFWRRSWRHRVGRLTVFCGFVYLAILGTLLALEDRLLFRASRKSESWNDPPPNLAVEDVMLPRAGGPPVHAWWAAPPGWAPSQGAVLICHGNGGNLSWRGPSMRQWVEEMRTAVLLIDYPGYGKSGGDPSESGCYAGGDTAFDWLTDNRNVPPGRILLFGGSLGGAVATDLAARRPHRALVLLCAFTSFPDMAQKSVPWLPGRWLVHNQFDNLKKIPSCAGPVFIAHGTEDQLVPYSQGERLFEAAREPKRFLPLAGFQHRDTPPSAFFPALRVFLKEQESGTTPNAGALMSMGAHLTQP
jgi:fermentation-respiration switch protein FrsA (DUF1100 family)